MTFSTDRTYAEEQDAADPLAQFRDRFVHDDPALIYLDGNSLGPLPVRTQARIADVVDQEWGVGLIRSWDRWMDLPAPGRRRDRRAPDRRGPGPGTGLRLDHGEPVQAGLGRPGRPGRGRDVIVTDDDNFPTDRYVLEGIAAAARR